MTTQLRIVAVGFLSPLRDEIICGGDFGDTWHEGAQKSIDALPPDHPTLFAQYDAYHMGITDRDLGLPSVAVGYDDAEQRAAYLAGFCAARRILSAAEILRELEILHDAMDDDDFWRIGAW